jgi:hypothetical protein
MSYQDTVQRLFGIRHRGNKEARQKTWFYIWGFHPSKGDSIVKAESCHNDIEADNYASHLGFSSYEVIPLDTSDLAKASQIIRAMKLERTQDVPASFERFNHTVNGPGGF